MAADGSLLEAVSEPNSDHEPAIEPHWPGELRYSPSFGNYIVAKRHIAQGEIICEEFPLVVSPASPYFSLSRDNDFDDENMSIYICVNCCKKVTELSTCSQCQWPICQNGVCEKASYHLSGECKILSSNKILTNGDLLNYYGLEMLRYLLLRDREIWKWKKILHMESHIDARRKCPFSKQLTNRLMEFAKKCSLNDYSEDVIDHVIGVLMVNTYWSNSSLSSRYASLLFHRGSLFNHDCAPNAKREILERTFTDEDGFLFDKIFLRITALRDIEPEDSLTISYIECEQACENRQKILFAVFYFMCSCQRCISETSPSNRNLPVN